MKRITDWMMAAVLLLTLAVIWYSALQAAPLQPTPSAQMMASPEQQQTTEPIQPVDETCVVQLLDGDEVLQLSLQTYLTGVLLQEMPVSFAPAALQAQAVASRTYALAQMAKPKHTRAQLCSDSTCCQAWANRQTLQEKFGEDFDTVWQRAAEAVHATQDQVLTMDGALITATYFSCSGGMTEAAVAVWGSDVPYLQAVQSPGEEQASAFSSGIQMTPESFVHCLEDIETINLTGDPSGWLGGCTRTAGGGVAQMELGGVWIDGTELRSRFGLNSTRFDLTYDGSQFCFSVTGFGHRVGMSQYGAQAMAQEGADYETILLHYYTGVELRSAADLTAE